VIFIDFLFILGFIVYVVLRALGESNKKRQEYERRARQRPKSQVPRTEASKPDLTEDYFPPLVREEEIIDELGQVEEYGKDTSTVSEGYGLKNYSFNSQIETDNIPIGSHRSEGFNRDKQIISESFSPNYSLQLTREQIWQGVVWSEILKPPKCKVRSR